MNRIKMFEEYTRTMGFRYSEPSIEILIQIPSVDDGLAEIINSVLDEDNVSVKEVNFVDGAYDVVVLVYNEKEIGAIVDNLLDVLTNKYVADINTEDVFVKKV
jgi:hypothetical protein